MVSASSSEQGWWLYGNDLELAQTLQDQRIRASRDEEEQAQQIAILTYLGAYQQCRDWLNRTNALHYSHGRYALCRAQRAAQDANPWAALAPPERLAELLGPIDQAAEQDQPIGVDLVGGIGDQLETSSLVLMLNKLDAPPVQLRLHPGQTQADVIRPFLASSIAAPLLTQTSDDLAVRVSSPLFRYWLGTIQAPIQYGAIKATANPGAKRAQRTLILTCWRTKPDPIHPLSSFSRSLPFRTIFALMQRWQSQLNEANITLLDMSEYTAEETALITTHFNNVKCIRPKIQALSDTIQYMEQCIRIASVDTSLTHLSATCGRDVDLLLPLHPDERWLELLQQPGVYQDHVTPHQQVSFHDWEQPLQSLSHSLQLI